MPSSPANAHKGLYGTVLVIGGDEGMAGAAAMAAEAALRCGAGLVRVATRPEHVAALVARTPEVMPLGVSSGPELEPLLEAADVLVVGPGLGQSPWSEYLLQMAAASGKPMVLDADGLNLLAAGKLGSDTRATTGCSLPIPVRLRGCCSVPRGGTGGSLCRRPGVAAALWRGGGAQGLRQPDRRG